MTPLSAPCRPSTGPWTLVGAFLVLLQALASPVHAQILGRVLDSATGEPLPDVGVMLLDSTGVVHAQVVSNRAGRFFMDPIGGAGEYEVQVVALGYVDIPSDPLTYEGRGVAIEVLLDPEPIGMVGIEVTVETRHPALDAQGFYDRRRSRPGYFLSPEDLEGRVPVRSSEVFRRIPGVEVRDGEPRFTRRVAVQGGVGCLPDIWVDGVPLRQGGRSGQIMDMFDLVLPAPQDIGGVEVYSGAASIPARFRTLSAGCGVIVVWTRR